MPRRTRIVVPGWAHHPPSPAGYGVTSITQRGRTLPPWPRCSSRSTCGMPSSTTARWAFRGFFGRVLAGAVLLVSAGEQALLDGDSLRRAEPRAGGHGRPGRGLPVVQRGLAVRAAPRRLAGRAGSVGLAAMAVEHASSGAACRLVALAGRQRRRNDPRQASPLHPDRPGRRRRHKPVSPGAEARPTSPRPAPWPAEEDPTGREGAING